MKYNIVVATHHKTGTVWMDGVFKAIASDLGVRLVNHKADAGRLDVLLREPFILFSDDSDFRDIPHVLEREDVRILHLIRDPRDILISAMHYHRRAREGWLHEPAPRYLGMTYQQALRGQRSRFQQFVFEMENSTACTLQDIRAWRYDRPNCHEARYEDLREDFSTAYWRSIMAFLGLDAAEQDLAARRFWQNSLFGALPRLGNRHVRSGTVGQWRREFTVRLGYAFSERFPGLLQELKYEADPRWILTLPQSEAPALLAQAGLMLGTGWAVLTQAARAIAEG